MKSVFEKYRTLPYVSAFLVLVNVVVYAVCSLTGNQLYLAGRSSVYETVINKEYGRIVWSLFLHSDVNHIFNNMLLLLFLGGMIEKEIGHICYALCYFLSGIGGSLLSLAYKISVNDFSASIGASGAVFGLDGMLLGMVLLGGKRMATVTPTRVILMIVLSLYNGFSGDNIDNAAHIGGLVTGFLLSIVICVFRKRMNTWAQRHVQKRGDYEER